MKIVDLEKKYGAFYVPTFQVRVGGKDTLQALLMEITSVQVDSTLEGADRFTFVVNNGFDAANRKFVHLFDTFAFGTPVEISMGYGDLKGTEILIEGIVTSVATSFPAQGLPQITVSGFDRSHCMLKGARSESWHDTKDSDVAVRIAQRHKLRPVVTDTRVPLPKVEMSQESDWALLARLAERNAFEVYVRRDELHFGPPKNDASAVVSLEWGFGLKSFNPEAKINEVITRVEVVGWDVATKAEIVGSAGPKDEPGRDPGRKSGGEQLRSVCKDSTTLRVRRPVHSKAQADVFARAILKRRAESFLTGTGESIGIPAILPDTNVELLGIGDAFSRTYYVDQATHTIDGSGYRTTFRVKDTTL